MGKYIILTNKETFQTTIQDTHLVPIETFEFFFFDQLKAKYTIAEVQDDNIKIRLYEKYEDKEYVNEIRVKFFESFETVEGARAELKELVGPDTDNARLVQISHV